MKKIYAFILFGAAIFAVAACNNELQIEDNNQTDGPVYETLSVKVGAETKASLATDAAKTTFEEGDKIAVWTGVGEFQTCLVDVDGKISVDISGGARSNYAVYYNGATLPTFAESTLSLTLPATYAYTDVAGDKNPVPMVAKNEAGEVGDMTFYAVGTLFRVTVKAIPSDATGLVFQFPGNKVNGTFTVTNPGTSTPSVATSAPGSGEDKVTVTFAAGTATEMTLNIPLPTGAYEDVYITPVGSETKVASARHIAAGGYTAARARGKQFTATLVSFTIGDGKKAIFSPANLVATIGADYASTKWFFHAHQYDMVYKSGSVSGKPETYQSFSEGANIDLFGFVGSSSEYSEKSAWGISGSTNNEDYGTGSNESLKHDWGASVIGNYPANFWHTPSIEEWECVFRSRTTTEVRFCKAMLFNNGEGGVLGVILFPDNYVHPYGVTAPTAINAEDGTASSVVNSNNYSKADWEKMEAAGAVFLPSAGYRQGSNLSNVNAYTIDTPMAVRLRADAADNDGRANRVNINTASMAFGGNQRSIGMSVRLVRDLN